MVASPLLAALDEAAIAMAVFEGLGLRLRYATPAYLRLFPSAGQDMSAGQSILASRARLVLQTAQPALARQLAVAGGTTATDRLCDISFSPVRGGVDERPTGVLVVAVDVTDRVRALREAEADRERLLLLDHAAKAVAAEVEPRRELAALAASVVPSIADACAIHLWHPATPQRPRGWLTRLFCHIDPSLNTNPNAKPPRPGVIVSLPPQSPVIQAVRRRRAIVTKQTMPGDHEPWLAALPVTSLVAVPVLVEGAVHAVVTFVTADNREPFRASDISLLREITARATVSVQHALHLQRTTEVSLALQRSFLSEPPRMPGLDIAVRYRPAGPGLEIGGDWYDAIRLPDGGGQNRVGVAIGDVVGHDLPAATAMAQLRSMLQALACQGNATPATVLTHLNRISSHLEIGSCASLIYGEVRRDQSGEATFTWANAGHPAPVLLGAEAAYLSPRIQPLLGVSDRPYEQDSVVLPSGSTLLLFTDGLVEHREDGSKGQEPFVALAHLLAGSGQRDPRELLALLDSWASTEDDLALLAVRVAD